MPGTVDFEEIEYEKLKETKPSGKLINVVDDIVEDLVLNHKQLIIDIEKNNVSKELLRNEVKKYIVANQIVLEDANSFDEVFKQVGDYIWGYGCVQKYLEMEETSDVDIRNYKDIWVKVNNKRVRVPVEFPSEKALLNFAYAVCIKNGGNLNERNAEQVLSDRETLKDFKLRITVSIPPINIKSASLCFRKLPKEKYTYEDLLNKDMFNLDMYIYFVKMMKAGLNVVWGGKGGAGKTTHMNASLEYIPEEFSKLILQESDELTTKKKNVISKMVKKKTAESEVEYTLQDLVTMGLLEDIDVMVVGESKGAESMDLIDAGYTGHKIYVTTHSPSADKTLNKMVMNMKKSGTSFSRENLLEMLSELDVIIFMSNFKCIEVTEIAGFDYKTKEIEFNPIFKFVPEKLKDGQLEGYFKRVGTSCPKVLNKLKLADFELE